MVYTRFNANREELVKVYTAGYEGRDIEGFVSLLAQHGVELLVDVRLTPISRKPGFSKTKLSQHLEAAGIRYRHDRVLGNPKEFRKQASSVSDCLEMYREHMEPRWEEALSSVRGSLAAGDVLCLLCMERDASCCHRSIVADALQAERPEIEFVNL